MSQSVVCDKCKKEISTQSINFFKFVNKFTKEEWDFCVECAKEIIEFITKEP